MLGAVEAEIADLGGVSAFLSCQELVRCCHPCRILRSRGRKRLWIRGSGLVCLCVWLLRVELAKTSSMVGVLSICSVLQLRWNATSNVPCKQKKCFCFYPTHCCHYDSGISAGLSQSWDDPSHINQCDV